MSTPMSPDRMAAVRRYEILDAPADGAFDRIARMAATAFGTPIATVSIVDVDRVWFAAAKGLDGVTQVGVEPGLCASAVHEAGPYIVNNAEIDPRTLDHPLVRGELGLRFYAAAPIITSDGHALGTVTAIGQASRDPAEITDSQVSLLTDLAGTVADLLEVKLAALTALRSERLILTADAARLEAAHELAARMSDAAESQDVNRRPSTCRLGGQAGCTQPAELKVADSWGDSAWGCFEHAEDALINIPSVFLATESTLGLAAYIGRAPIAELPDSRNGS